MIVIVAFLYQLFKVPSLTTNDGDGDEARGFVLVIALCLCFVFFGLLFDLFLLSSFFLLLAYFARAAKRAVDPLFQTVLRHIKELIESRIG